MSEGSRNYNLKLNPLCFKNINNDVQNESQPDNYVRQDSRRILKAKKCAPKFRHSEHKNNDRRLDSRKRRQDNDISGCEAKVKKLDTAVLTNSNSKRRSLNTAEQRMQKLRTQLQQNVKERESQIANSSSSTESTIENVNISNRISSKNISHSSKYSTAKKNHNQSYKHPSSSSTVRNLVKSYMKSKSPAIEKLNVKKSVSNSSRKDIFSPTRAATKTDNSFSPKNVLPVSDKLNMVQKTADTNALTSFCKANPMLFTNSAQFTPKNWIAINSPVSNRLQIFNKSSAENSPIGPCGSKPFPIFLPCGETAKSPAHIPPQNISRFLLNHKKNNDWSVNDSKLSCNAPAFSPSTKEQKASSNSNIKVNTFNNKNDDEDSVISLLANDNVDEVCSGSNMDWQPINEENILANINEIRREINYFEKIATSSFNNCCDRPVPSSGIFIIVDTNIFLSHLSFLSRLMETHFKGLGPTVIVAPWMVIQELDYMKDGRSESRALKNGARKAVDFIHDSLKKKLANFKGQTVIEASQYDLSSNNPDDGILFCCMQLVQQGKSAVLLSNDKHLRNKALVNNINSFSHSEILDNLHSSMIKNIVPTNEQSLESYSVDKIELVLSGLLSNIIETEMHKAYGDLWTRMALMVPPLTVGEALRCLDKYWCAVFSFNLMKQCKPCVEEFSMLVQNKKCRATNKADYDKYIALSLNLCLYLKNGYNQYRENIANAIQSIQQHAD